MSGPIRFGILAIVGVIIMPRFNLFRLLIPRSHGNIPESSRFVVDRRGQHRFSKKQGIKVRDFGLII